LGGGFNGSVVDNMILLECIYCTGFDNVVKSLTPLNLPFLISVNMRLGSQLNMPQIQINGELREVSQAEYDALTTNGQASTPAAGSYEQYAAAIAKEQAVTKLADADANFKTGTNVSPEFVALKDQIRSDATAAAGENAASYAERYAQEQRELYANGETNLAALREELSAPAPTTAPGTVGVQISEQQGTDGEIIGTLNTASPAPGQSVEPVLSEIVDASPAEVNPTVDPQANLPADVANAPDPTVAEYFQNKAELEAVQKTFAVEEGDRATFVANPEERAEFIARLEENNQRLEAELEQKGLLDAVQQAEEQDRIENAAAQPPIGSLAELYPDDEPTAVSEAEIETEATTELTAQAAASDPEVSAFEEQQAPEAVPLAEVETLAATELTAEQTAADPEVIEPAAEAVPVAEVELDPTVVSEADPQLPAETIEPFVSGLAGTDDDPQVPVAGVDIFPEALIYEAGEPPTQDPIVLAQAENIVTDVPLSNIDAEPALVDPAIDPEIIPQGDFVLSAADIDGGEDLDQDPGPGYGDVDEPLDPDILDRANEVEVDPYEDVLGRDLTEEEIQAEDNPVDYDLEEDIDPYNAIADRDLTEEEIAAEDNPIEYSNEVEVDPYEDVLGRDLTEEEIQAEDNPVDYDLENEIDPYSEVENSGDPTLTDEEIDAARADQQIEFGPDGLTTLSSAEAARQQSTLDRARAQYILQQQRKQANDGDWRVRLRLAPNAQYLYKSDQPGILQPLAVTDGVVFPYTPQITTAYKATYSPYDLTHSNYRGFFYQSSQVDDIQLNATFTAQDTA
jgi:hypothetical protein